MRHDSWFIWGFAASVVLITIMAGSQTVGLTRMNIPYLLGTMFTADRDRAKVIGIGIHLLIGWLFAFVYAAAFHAWGAAGWWRGGIIGLVHAAFLLLVGLPALAGIHPRMASEQHGPTPKRQLEPPGLLALHYGCERRSRSYSPTSRMERSSAAFTRSTDRVSLSKTRLEIVLARPEKLQSMVFQKLFERSSGAFHIFLDTRFLPK